MSKIPSRRPTDKLAGCMWLARLTEKIRIHLAGELDHSFQMPFCNRRATDGLFFAHFGLTKEEIIEVVRTSNGDDEKIATWFLTRSADMPEKIAAWNKIAPHLGRAGYPGEAIFAWAKKNVYNGPTDPRLTSIFLLIAADEGYLEAALAEQLQSSPS